MSQDPVVSGSTDGSVVDAVTIERFVAGGKGLGHMDDGRVVLVEGGVPGDRLAVVIVKDRARLVEARVDHVLEAGPSRVTPPCPEVARGCGGCDLQHVESSQQVGLKAEIVADAIRRIAKIDGVEVRPGVSLAPFGYRTTLRCSVDPSTGRLGFRRRHSHVTHVVDDCMIAHPLAAEVIRDSCFPARREVTVRVSAATAERMVVVTGRGVTGLDGDGRGGDGRDGDGRDGDYSVPEGVAVVFNGDRPRGRRGPRRPGRRRPVVSSPGLDDAATPAVIHEVVAGHRFRISPGSFFQARPDGADALVDAVGRALPGFDPSTDRLVDLYGGVGLFSAGLGARDGELVEMSRSATADAAVNLAHLGTTIRTVEVGQWSPSRADVVVADPARSGLGRDGVAAVTGTGARAVALVSCDPASMARDARMLVDSGYELLGVELVDMFPQTHHIEVVTGFHRK